MIYLVIVANTVEKQLDELPEKMKLRGLKTIAQLVEELLILVIQFKHRREVYQDLK